MMRIIALLLALFEAVHAFAPAHHRAPAWRARRRSGRLAAEPLSRRRRAPAGTRAVLTRTDAGSLDLRLPARGLSLEDAPTAAFAGAWLATIGLWTRGALAASPVMAVASLPFWLVGAQLVGRVAVAPLTTAHLTIGEFAWTLDLGGPNASRVGGATDDLDGAEAAAGDDADGGAALVLAEGVRRHALRVPLTPPEVAWLADEINGWLRDARAVD